MNLRIQHELQNGGNETLLSNLAGADLALDAAFAIPSPPVAYNPAPSAMEPITRLRFHKHFRKQLKPHFGTFRRQLRIFCAVSEVAAPAIRSIILSHATIGQ